MRGEMMDKLHALIFASDATLAALWGGGFILAAALCMWAENRRNKRKVIDAVGWMPWTKMFFVCTLIGLTLMVMALKGWSSAS